MKRLKVHQFENGIYQPCIFIVADNRLSLISENFTETDGSELDLEDINEFVNAFVYPSPVFGKDNDNKGGWLIVFKSKKHMSTEIMAHEAYHAMEFYAEQIGLGYTPGGCNESRAYLLGWIVKCCKEVKNYKELKQDK